MSFKTVLSRLATNTFLDYAALTTFVSTKWQGRSLTVKKSYKKRVEIHSKNLPQIIITRPSVAKSFRTGVRDSLNIVRLYAGFYQPDHKKGLEELIEFEELIDDAIRNDTTLDSICLSVNPLESANDEGKNYPNFFLVMDIEIGHRRAE